MMEDGSASFDWVQILDRYGVSAAIIFFLAFCVYKVGAWAGPILREYIDKRIEREDKRAEAAVMSAHAAVQNAQTLSETAERSIEVQKENADTNKRFADTLDRMLPILERIDHIAFPHKH